MVKITGYQKRTAQDESEYFALELQSDELEFVVSKTTGRHYATVKKAWMSCTFNEDMCESMLGRSMQGTVIKEECDPYTFPIGEDGEEITRTFRYAYAPEESSLEAAVFDTELEKELA